ncbi:MAG TPA: Rieske (2Fe-2S) protein [Blastocatellia bacterium]|jgi:Rieske Fe-S protein
MSSEQITTPPDGKPDVEQPRWRKDFPIDWPQDHFVARRDFTKFMVLTSFAFVAGQFWIVLQNFFRARRGEPLIERIAGADEIPVGGSRTFSYPEEHRRSVLVRTDENTFIAYSQECTHLSCAVVPEVEQNRFLCPCHQGIFDLKTGQPIAGPPRRGLERIKLEIRQGTVYATGIETGAV